MTFISVVITYYWANITNYYCCEAHKNMTIIILSLIVIMYTTDGDNQLVCYRQI